MATRYLVIGAHYCGQDEEAFPVPYFVALRSDLAMAQQSVREEYLRCVHGITSEDEMDPESGGCCYDGEEVAYIDAEATRVALAAFMTGDECVAAVPMGDYDSIRIFAIEEEA